jgi:predicted  nucleic acid-binding Zn-ribbon protein
MKQQQREPTMQELELGIKIDQHQLEIECCRQPDLYYRVATRVATETSLRDAAKERLADVEAEADSEVRRAAIEEQTKITENYVESKKRVHPSVQEARQDYFELKKSVDLWTALLEAFSQRSYMLKTLGELYVANYYSDTSQTGVATGNAHAARAREALQQERIRRK